MQTKIEQISPAKAQELLKSRSDNRPVRRRWVEQIAGEMKRGQWVETHQGIAIDTDGQVIDGQHRLLAVIEANVTVSLLVTRGLDKSTYRVIDSGLTRTVGDRLKLLSDPHHNQVACRLVRAYLTAAMRHRGRVSVDLVENCFLSMPDEFTDVAEAFAKRKAPGLTRSDVGAAIVCYASKHKVKAYAFMDRFLGGEGLAMHDPELMLREALFMRRIGWHDVYDGYWKTISATRWHYEGKPMRGVTTATKDWRGSEYQRLAKLRFKTIAKGNKTKAKNKNALGLGVDLIAAGAGSKAKLEIVNGSKTKKSR